MYDLRKSYFSQKAEKHISSGYSFTEEGQCAALDTDLTSEYYKPTSAITSRFAGFALVDNQSYSVMPRTESKTIPSSGTLTVQLDKTTPVVDITAATKCISIYIVYADGTTPVYMTQVAWTALATNVNAINKFQITAAGLMAFYSNVAVKGAAITIYYKYNLTVEESNRLYYERSVNNKASATLGQFTLAYGEGEIYTSEYYAGNWDTADNTNFAGIGNLVTCGSSGLVYPIANLAANSKYVIGEVIKPPTATDPLLGIHYWTNRMYYGI